jgi:hypothetical protein
MSLMENNSEYTSYKVKGILKPKYVQIVKDFCTCHQWQVSENTPKCIAEWLRYQDSISAFKIIDGVKFYSNRIPFGLPSPWWGSECIVYEDHTMNDMWWWSFSGEMKNTHAQIEQFIHCVVGQLCSSIDIFWTCKETESQFTTHTVPLPE